MTGRVPGRIVTDVPTLDEAEARRRFAGGAVARMATVRPDGAPHVLPVTFAVVGSVIYTAVDDKPKRRRRLQRLTNVGAEPRCALLVDHYDQDWTALWWVRADGRAVVISRPGDAHEGIVALRDRYAQYQDSAPAGPLMVVTVSRWAGWAATG